MFLRVKYIIHTFNTIRMSQQIFKCGNEPSHVIVDVSGEPIPHIGKNAQIYCPVCEQDVSGTYLGQDMSEDTRIGELNLIDEIDLYTIESDKPYCMKCDGPCEANA